MKLNGKRFYVIKNCVKEGHTLCVAKEPWGVSAWGEETNGQKILDIADNRNPESLTYKWFQSLPDDVKASMLTVNVSTNDKNFDGKGGKMTEMFVPSASEWAYVSSKKRKRLCDSNVVWTRSFGGYSSSGKFYYGLRVGNREGNDAMYVDDTCKVVPAFYIKLKC